MAKTTILIVDDTEATRNVLRDIVQEILREGVEISTASSLEQGMGFAERVQKGNIVLDAAFIDIELGKDPVTSRMKSMNSVFHSWKHCETSVSSSP